MGHRVKTIEIPADEAVFWLDANGSWHNSDGKFRHKKIIDYFHAAIRKDARGYYLYQERGNIREKVYFYCEDTALFAVDLINDPDVTLILNTRERIKLKPKSLFIKDDNLYMKLGAEIIKFSARGLLKISDLLLFEDETYFIKVNKKKYRILEK